MAETKKTNKKLETNIPKKRKTKFTCKRCGNKYPSEIAETINKEKYCPHCYNFLKEDEVFERKIRQFLNDMANTTPHSQKNAGDSLLAAVKRQEFTLRGVYYTLEYLTPEFCGNSGIILSPLGGAQATNEQYPFLLSKMWEGSQNIKKFLPSLDLSSAEKSEKYM